MNPIQYAIRQVRFRIPKDILETVFIDPVSSWNREPTSLDSLIEAAVIRPRLMVDCDIIGGSEILVNLSGLTPIRISDHSYVFQIPKRLTQGRSITTALNITYSDPNTIGNIQSGSSFGGCQSSFMLGTAQQLVDAAGMIPITGTSNLQIIGENTILVRETTMVPPLAYLRCIIANDYNLSNLQIKSHRPFAEAAVLCVKAYIYNQYIITMDMGEIRGGANIGRFKEIVESYADAEELYQTYLKEKLEKIFFMNDHTRYNRFLRLAVGGAR